MVSEHALPRAPKSAERIDGAMIAGGAMVGGSATAVSDSGDCLCDEDSTYCFDVELEGGYPTMAHALVQTSHRRVFFMRTLLSFLVDSALVSDASVYLHLWAYCPPL